ncbi:methylated-DNA--[protein]-cysteine S-methyltransferase [Peribacillus alkalitolerans]|uniref:methylated-DNA--[protein]-cysteine S-methyltransferase n=1 Tax=Peribacillus alkalitolerans TaxID=1550385 RepID=UPI0013D2EA53|nr:methylated-DNA--[protein]-cysteine S-methyltransferase [Peribacillus alkalitolerans]
MTTKIFYDTFYHPIIGDLWLIADEKELLRIVFEKEEMEKVFGFKLTEWKEHPIFIQLTKELTAYLQGKNIQFSVPFSVKGTDFQKDVWNVMSTIPFGETKSYKEVADIINRPLAVRAVGQACKGNRFPFIIPCHRIIGKSGALTGYAGDKTSIKEKLLKLEGLLN